MVQLYNQNILHLAFIENWSSIWVNCKLSVVSGSFLYCVYSSYIITITTASRQRRARVRQKQRRNLRVRQRAIPDITPGHGTNIKNGSSIWVNRKLSVMSGSFLYCVYSSYIIT